MAGTLGKGANRSVSSANYINGISRTKCPRHFKFHTTFNSGKLIPLFCDEYLPAQTRSVNIGELVRSITPLGPTMDNSFLDIFCFFVPRRLVWDHWEEFIAGYNKEAWAQDVVYTVPKIKLYKALSGADYKSRFIKSGSVQVNACSHSFLDYMAGALDCPSFVYGIDKLYNENGGVYTLQATQDQIDAMYDFNAIDACYPRAFVKIWNDWFRDENLDDEYELYTGDNDEYAFDFAFDLLDPEKLPDVAKYHNRFTTCLPSPVKGPDVLIPTKEFAWLDTQPVGKMFASKNGLHLDAFDTSTGEPIEVTGTYGAEDGYAFLYEDVTPTGLGSEINGSNLGVNLKSAMGTIRQLRLATQTELLLARDARGGTRYVESLLSHFGVHNGDARLQRAEYLGSRQIPISITQVTNTSQADSNALGNVGGQSVTKDNAHYFTYSATEHGILWVVACVRTNLSYSSGVRKIYQRWNRFDHVWPEFKHIGDVPLYLREHDTAELLRKAVDYGVSHKDRVFGYTPYGSELREGYNFNNGLFRISASGNLSYLTYQESFPDNTFATLSSDYIKQSPNPIYNTLIDQNGPQFYALFDIYMEDTIPLDPTSDPGLMDHF